MDDSTRLRLRRSGFLPPDHDRATGGTPRMLGKVTSSGANIAAGKFLLVNPVTVSGAEAEGGPGTFAVDASTAVPVYLARGAPATGDYLACRFVGHRWVAVKRSGGGTTPIGIGIPGCYCQGTPASLALGVTFGVGEDSGTYANAYQPCTIAWFDATTAYGTPGDSSTLYYATGTAPSYLPAFAYTGPGYYSTTSWVDDYGFTDYFRLNCYTTQYALGFGQNALGIWQAPGQIYNWSLGGVPAVNTCTPFALLQGRPQQGIIFNGKFVITG